LSESDKEFLRAGMCIKSHLLDHLTNYFINRCKSR
jgi:hypothetical protein